MFNLGVVPCVCTTRKNSGLMILNDQKLPVSSIPPCQGMYRRQPDIYLSLFLHPLPKILR